MHHPDCRCARCLVDRSLFGTPEAKAARASVTDEQVARVVARAKELEAEHWPRCNPQCEGDKHYMQAERNICSADPHSFVWTWPIEGESGSVGVCQLCGAVTTADRDEAKRAEGLAVAKSLLRKVVAYWDGRPLAHHGDHIYADLRDVLRAITPADRTETEPKETQP